jgi:hypothetical protein
MVAVLLVMNEDLKNPKKPGNSPEITREFRNCRSEVRFIFQETDGSGALSIEWNQIAADEPRGN